MGDPLSAGWLVLARSAKSSTKRTSWEALSTAVQQPDFVDTNSNELCRLLLEYATATAVTDMHGHRAATSVVRQALGSNAFLKEFVAALVKLENVALTPAIAVTLIAWSALAMEKLNPASATKAICKLIECQAAWLNILSQRKCRRLARVSHQAICRALASHETLLDHYLMVASSNASAALVHAIWSCVAKTPDTATTVAPQLLQIFVDKALSAKEKPSEAVLVEFEPLLAAATPDHVATILLPAALRMVRRSPEAALGTTTFMLRSLSHDLSAHEGEVGPLLLQQARHARESVRRLACEASGAFAAHISDPAALQSFLAAASQVLDGTSDAGKLKSPQERASIAAVIESLASAPAATKAAHSSGATSTLDFLSTYYSSEITEEVRVGLLRAMGAWMCRCSTLPPSTLNRLTEGLKEKDALRRGHLKAAAAALAANSDIRADLGADITSKLGVLAKDGASKAAARADGLLALLVGAYAASADTTADVALESSGAWSAATSADSPLIAPKTAASLANTDAVTMAELMGALLSLHPSRLGGFDDSSSAATAAARSLALLALHFCKHVRASALSAMHTVVAADVTSSMPLLEALQHWISSRGAAAELSIMLDASHAAAEVQPPVHVIHKRCLRALLAAVPTSPLNAAIAGMNGSHESTTSTSTPTAMMPPRSLAVAMLLAHHPLVAGQHRGAGRKAWAAVQRRGSIDVGKSIAANPADVASLLVHGSHGVASTDEIERQAAYEALRTAAAAAAPPLYAPFMQAIAPLLDRSSHDELTPRQLRIYGTPIGRLSNENEDGSIIPVELFEEMLADKAAVKAPTFPPMAMPTAEAAATSGSGGGASSKPTPSSKPSAPASRGVSGARPSKPAAKDAAAVARIKQLKSEAEVRAGVVAIRETLSRGLASLGAFSRGNATFSAEHLSELAAPALPLLTSPLVGASSALECTRQLVTCLPGALRSRAADVSASLRLVFLVDASGKRDYQPLATQRCMSTAVLALQLATGGLPASEEHAAVAGMRPLPGPAYAFCFPILRAVLSCPRPTPLHDPALAVVALQITANTAAASAPAVPDAQVFDLLYHVLCILPAFRERVQGLLRTLCGSIGQAATADDASTATALLAALQGLSVGPSFARGAALAALKGSPALAEGSKCAAAAGDDGIGLLWLARCDPNTTNAEAARELWDSSGCALPPTFVASLMHHVSSPHEDIRSAAANALAEGVGLHITTHPDVALEALDAVTSLYAAGQGRDARLGAAAALKALAPSVPRPLLTKGLDFLLSAGLVDDDASVRSAMVAAGVAVVDAGGPESASALMPLFESYLDRKAAVGGLTEEQYDHVRQGAVVFLGTLARHLNPAEPKVRSIVDMLIEVLTTPSEAVQRSVSDCLPPLMQALQSDTVFFEKTVKALLDRALHGASYGDRRGAAFGLAGAVKGLGLSALKGQGIMEALKSGVEDKANANAREGSLCAFECLSDKLGRLFEPYVIHILPSLLTAFGDPSPQVRDAAVGAARVIMGQLSAQGVKLVLPALLKGAEDKAWRTKQGSVQLLGAMAHCAPKQLSACLPTIVPRLGEVLADPHPRVGSAARQALEEVGSVIRNPEVSKLAPTLLAAVAEPGKANRAALDTLLSTVFVNTVDAASLALIIPVVHRGLRERSGDSKKRAARIVGNLCALVNDPRDMSPYISLLLPELQAALIDPLPEVRATSAKALGALVGGVGIDAFPELHTWLFERMQSESSAVERSGAAQGLAEIISMQGAGALEAAVRVALEGTSARSPAAREGCLTLFKYLPYCTPDVFQQYLPDVLPAVLMGLADESEGVRDAAMSAGRVAVELYANSALPLLLPAVEAGAANANWRIRQSSIELLGELLFKVVGTSGRIQQDVHDEDTEGISAEAHGAAVVEALGEERRNEVLARLYVARSDSAYTVRSAALHVWKTIVTNTPKTLGEVLPALMEQVIEALSGGEGDRREAAGRCLGELVRKMGERVLAQILPILKQGMHDDDATTRAGVCEGLREVLENASRHQLADHLAELLPAVQKCLCDPDAAVRTAAGGAFNVLFKSGAGSVIDSVIPSLLLGLDARDESAATRALEGLRVVLGVRPQLMSTMVPRLVKPPIGTTSLRALGALAEVAGPSIHTHLPVVMPPIMRLANNRPDTSPTAAAAHAALASTTGAVGEDGLHVLVTVLLAGLDDVSRRRGACAAIVSFCKNTKLEYEEHVPALLSALVPLLAEEDADDVASAWEAVSAVTASIPKEMAPSFVRTLKDAVATTRERSKRLRKSLIVPGFSLPKALAPLLPIYLQGVLQGASAELRELAADGLGELVEATSEDALKPFVVQITGPLIRIAGDRFPWQTKAAILQTMGLVASRAGIALRPFVPQLQTTFVKCLVDPAAAVRHQAASNLGDLTKMAPRLEQLVSDVAAGARAAGTVAGAQQAYLEALQGALRVSGDRLTPETVTKAGQAGQEAMRAATAVEDEPLMRAAAAVLGAYAERCSDVELQTVLEVGPLSPPGSGKLSERLCAALVAAAVADRAAMRLEDAELLGPFLQAVVKLSRDENVEVKQAAGKAAGRIIAAELEATGTSRSLASLVPLMVALLGPDQHSEVQRQGLAVLRRIAAAEAGALQPHYGDLVPSIIGMVQDSSGTTKLSTERTLARVLQLDQGLDAANAFLASGQTGALVKRTLTEAYMRRLSKLPMPEEDDLGEEYRV